MIADVLSDAIRSIDAYLGEDAYREIYREYRGEIRDVMRRMDRLRAELDRPAGFDEETTP